MQSIFVTARLFTLIILSCDLSSATTDQNNLNFVNKNDFSILFLLITKNSIEFLLVKRSRFQWGFFFRRKEFNFHLISVQHFKSFSLTFAILLITLFMKGEVFLLVFFFALFRAQSFSPHWLLVWPSNDSMTYFEILDLMRFNRANNGGE